MEGGVEAEKWAKSTAKQVLKKDILLGVVTPEMDAATVYESRAMYKDYKLPNFTQNLASLIKVVQRDVARMQQDCEAYGHDRAILAKLKAESNEPPSPLSWHRSKARLTLKDDMQANVHKNKTPKEMWSDPEKPEYREFDLKVFRKAIYSAEDKASKKEFRFAKKKLRARAPDNNDPPPKALPVIPLTFGSSMPKKKTTKKKGSIKNRGLN